MPGWTPSDNFHNNIAYAPGMWIALHQICERNGVGDQFRIHYDPSHAILMGQDTRSLFQYLHDAGYGFIIAGMHVKGQVIDSTGVSAWGYGGQTVQRGDWVDGAVSSNPADLANSWKKQVVLCEHELPGTARHDPLAYLQNRTVDWLDHQLAARELLDFDPATTPLIVEHEYPAARVQERALLEPILKGSMAFTRHIDEAAAAMYALQHDVLPSQGIPVQGVGRQAYRHERSPATHVLPAQPRRHPPLALRAPTRSIAGTLAGARCGRAFTHSPRAGDEDAVTVLVVGTGDTKGDELAYVADDGAQPRRRRRRGRCRHDRPRPAARVRRGRRRPGRGRRAPPRRRRRRCSPATAAPPSRRWRWRSRRTCGPATT